MKEKKKKVVAKKVAPAPVVVPVDGCARCQFWGGELYGAVLKRTDAKLCVRYPQAVEKNALSYCGEFKAK